MVTCFGFTFNVYGAIMLFMVMVFLIALWREQKENNLDWTDMITRDGRKVSATKILQLVGGVVGTWIIIQLTLGEKITWDMFMIYLAYVASVDGFSKFVQARYGAEQRPYSHRRSYADQDEPQKPGSAKTPE